VGKQLVDPTLGVGLDPDQHIREVLLGVDAVEVAAAHERLVDREALAGLVVSDEEEVLAAEGDESQVALGDVMPSSGLCRIVDRYLLWAGRISDWELSQPQLEA
jgi:hypothetical protein